LIIMGVVVPADEEAPADAAGQYDDMHACDAYNDARYDMHVHDEAEADAVLDAARCVVPGGEEARADVVVAGRMHINLLADKHMRLYIFS
jgi:hypothetical protein